MIKRWLRKIKGLFGFGPKVLNGGGYLKTKDAKKLDLNNFTLNPDQLNEMVEEAVQEYDDLKDASIELSGSSGLNVDKMDQIGFKPEEDEGEEDTC